MSQVQLSPLAIAVAATFTVAACGGDRQEATPMADTAATTSTSMQPDTTAERLWSYLENENYRQWPMYPGKGAMYQGTDPHGARLTTYVNTTALSAITGAAGTLPEGSIIVKENYMPDSTLDAVTVMYKARGYDAAHNDWFWVKRLANGTVEASGRVEGCIGCHGQRAANDYIMTSALR